MRNLERIFNPKSIAVLGAKSDIKSVGWGLMKNVLEGKTKRKIFVVNPFKKEVFGIKCFPSIKSINETIDLAIIVVPARIVLKVVKECCEKRVGGLIIISSGFAERGEKGQILQKKITEMVKQAKIPLIGPNVLGIIRPSKNLNASFAPATPNQGKIAVVSQSGALIDSIIDRSLFENYGFSTLISYGNEADLELSDFLLWLKKDKETKVIAVYLEGLKNGQKFMKVAKEVVKIKPIVIIKAGRSKKGVEAITTHTASLAGDYEIYSAAFKQIGLIQVDTVEQLFDTAKSLAWQPKCKNNIGIVTNGGGCGVLMADYCDELGIKLAKLSKTTLKKLAKTKKMHFACSKRNPLDIIGDALAVRYKIGIEALLAQKDIYGLIIIQTLQIMTEPQKNAKIIVRAKKKWPKKPIICAFLGGKITKKGIEILEKNQIPNYSDLKRAAWAMKVLIKQ
ncbi:CoA-binding protein [Candidatus Parcubacteria bacterium]|nr:CoA-binding protein [Candidatus Parcubacteria bacterium]